MLDHHLNKFDRTGPSMLYAKPQGQQLFGSEEEDIQQTSIIEGRGGHFV